MKGYRNKYSRDKPNTENKESKGINIKVDTSINYRLNNPQNNPGRASAIFSLKRDNDISLKTDTRKYSKEKNKETNKENEKNTKNNFQAKTSKYSENPNIRWSVVDQGNGKERARWRRFNIEKNKEEDKPVDKNVINKDLKIIKEVEPNVVKETIIQTRIIEKKENKPNKVETKITKEEVVTKEQIPKIKEENKNDKKEEKAIYKYRREKLKPNKTDEDLPLPKIIKKEEVIVESTKRRTLATNFIPGSRRLFEEKENPPKKEEKINLNNKDKKIIEKIKEEKNEVNENKDNLKVKEEKNEVNENKDNLKIKEEKIEVNENKDNLKIKEEKIEVNENKENLKVKEEKNKLKSNKFNTADNKEIIKKRKNDEKKYRLKIALNEIEKAGAEKILKKDLVELFDKVVEYNLDFKDNIFYKVLGDTERKVGNMDRNPISHTYKEIETREIIKHMDNINGIMKKYTQKAKRIVDEN